MTSGIGNGATKPILPFLLAAPRAMPVRYSASSAAPKYCPMLAAVLEPEFEVPHGRTPRAATSVKTNTADFFMWLLSLPEPPKFQLEFYSLGRDVASAALSVGMKSTRSSRPFQVMTCWAGSVRATTLPPRMPSRRGAISRRGPLPSGAADEHRPGRQPACGRESVN